MKLIWIRAYILNHNLVLLYDKVHSFGMTFQVGATLEDHPHAAASTEC